MSDPIADLIGDYRAFTALQRDRLAARGIDIASYELSHDRAAELAGLETASLERRRLELKGKTQLTTIYVVHAERGSTP
jgi:hypothetical protein